MKPIALLRAAIAASGLSSAAYATDVLMRDPRTIRRWLEGKAPMPPAVVEYLKRTRTPAVNV